MYYERASSSSLFRTHFLNCLSGVAGASEACRSHSRIDIAKIVPSDAKILSAHVKRRSGTYVRCSIQRYEWSQELDWESCRKVTYRSLQLNHCPGAGHGEERSRPSKCHRGPLRHDTCNERSKSHPATPARSSVWIFQANDAPGYAGAELESTNGGSRCNGPTGAN